MFLLDTNVISELRKISLGRANLGVAEWASHIDPGDLYISVITVHELEVGILRAERRDAKQGAARFGPGWRIVSLRRLPGESCLSIRRLRCVGRSTRCQTLTPFKMA
jgi:predicted nucleic acid-binding protein